MLVDQLHTRTLRNPDLPVHYWIGRGTPHMEDERFSGLSESQKACLRLVGQGMSSKEIAKSLNLTPLTVDTYVKAAVARLGAGNRREAARALVGWDTSQKLGSPSQGLAVDPVHPDEYQPTMQRGGMTWWTGFLPPLGGRVNDLKFPQRVLAASKIAFLSSLALIAVAMILRQALKALS